jgi:phosphohistidine phosphatase
MDVYLIRHAEALPIGELGVQSDEERPLSDLGWKQAADVARVFKKLKIHLDMIATSPLVRAHQTAQQLRTSLSLTDAQVEVRDEVAPGKTPKKLARALNGLQGNKIAVVGHMPDISDTAGWMLGEKTVSIHFSKASVAHIRFEDAVLKGGGTLMWLITPEIVA